MKKTALATAVLLASSVLAGCGSSNSNDNPTVSSSTGGSSSAAADSSSSAASSSVAAQTTYSFTNGDGADSVSYTGQIARHVMIEDIKIAIGKIVKSAEPTVKADLMALFENPSNALDDNAIQMTVADYDLAQATYGDISTGKNLIGKIAGGYVDGTGAQTGETSRLIGEFIGWNTGLAAGAKPADLVEYLFDQLQALAASATEVTVSTATGDETVTKVFVDENGVDYQQLVQKFLLMAVGFSQGTNDYLSPDRDFSLELTGTPYTTAEHHFDEGFGYFGASRDYAELTDAEIIAAASDANADDIIDLASEYNFGQSVNCAKRDTGATVATDFTKDAIEGFIAGRTILDSASKAGTLTADQETDLNAAIGQAAGAWEKCIASTVVHYINDVRGDMASFDNGNYANIDSFYNLAKHWSEMKGFALGLQFSPYSPFRDDMGGLAMISYGDNETATLEDVLSWMGDAPVLADASDVDIAAYDAALLKARDVLRAAYDFATENVENW